MVPAQAQGVAVKEVVGLSDAAVHQRGGQLQVPQQALERLVSVYRELELDFSGICCHFLP
jgi:hypothetical protein